MKEVTLDIAGMRCGACAVGLELMLAKKKGVKSAKVSLIEKMAVVACLRHYLSKKPSQTLTPTRSN
jgi:copper chaperone CopZ